MKDEAIPGPAPAEPGGRSPESWQGPGPADAEGGARAKDPHRTHPCPIDPMSPTASAPVHAAPRPALGPIGLLQFACGLAAYAVGVAGLLALILRTLGVLPGGTPPVALAGTWSAIAMNLGLIAVFGVQHAIMARPAFKERWTRIVPRALERSIFVALSGLLMGAIVWLWQPLPAAIWTVEGGAARAALVGLCAAGWAYLLLASFAIDHFELFGLRQVWRGLHGLETPPPSFRARLMYHFDRHPIMTGVLVGLWSTPDLTLGRLVLALGFSAYIVVGVTIEERDLRRRHGATYAAYARRARTVVPTLPLDR